MTISKFENARPDGTPSHLDLNSSVSISNAVGGENCTACAHRNPTSSHFCNNCGAPLAQSNVADQQTSSSSTLPHVPVAPMTGMADAEDLVQRVARLEALLTTQSASHAPISATTASNAATTPLSQQHRLPVDRPVVKPHLFAGVAALSQMRALLSAFIARFAPRAQMVRLFGEVALGIAVSVILLSLLAPVLFQGAALVGLRQGLNHAPATLGVITAVALGTAVTGGLLFSQRRRHSVRALAGPQSLVVLALGLAAVGQGLLLSQQRGTGAVFYGVAAILAVIAAIWRPKTTSPVETQHEPRLMLRREPVLFGLVTGISIFMRLHLLGAHPYGIEGDEALWGRSVFNYMLVGDPVWPSGWQYKMSRGSFWIESLFFRTLGTSFFTARFMVALFSIVANVAFYVWARRISGVGVALIATLLLSVSITDVSASRLGAIESQIKLWTILAPCLLVLAVETCRRVLFVLCGLAVAGGLLTMDIFFPMSAVVGLWLLITVARQPQHRRSLIMGIGLFTVAVLVSVPFALETILLRLGEYSRYTKIFSASSSGVTVASDPNASLAFIRTNLEQLLTSLFVRQYWGDFLMNRQGPIVNAALLPFMVLGAVWTVIRIRDRHNGLPLLWFLATFFPAALIIGAVFVRVVYSAFPVLYFFAALGLWWSSVALRSLLPQRWHLGIHASLVGFVAAVSVFNGFIYFREVRDFDERMHRREIVDEVSQAYAPDRMTYLVFQPNRSDAIQIEQPTIDFVTQGKLGIGQHKKHYQHTPYSELLMRVSKDRNAYGSVRIIADGLKRDYGPERLEVLSALQRCFPGTAQRHLKYIAVYDMPGSALKAPACSASAQATLASPPANATLTPGQAVEFSWSVDGTLPPQFRIQVDQHKGSVMHIEAEEFSRDQGWAPENRYVGEFSGKAFLADSLHRAGKSSYRHVLPVAGRYDLWVRTYRRVLDDTHVFLEVNGMGAEIARSDSMRLNRWIWERVGSFDLPAGEVLLAFSKDFGTAQHMSIFIDDLMLSGSPDFDPSQQSLWDTVLDTGPDTGAANKFRLEMPLQPGQYRWRVQLLDGEKLVGDLGRPGAWSAHQEFTVSS